MPLGDQSVLYRSADVSVDNHDQYRARQHMYLERFFVRHRGHTLPICVAEIIRFEADDDYTAVHLPGKRYLIHVPLREMERIPSTYAPKSPNSLLNTMTIASRAEHSLSADIVLTWKTGGVSKRSTGTIRLMKPNYAAIKLSGDYPLLLLTSDGTSKFTVADERSYMKDAMDPRGEKIDSPWWGLPFRFFFTQSLNPFSATADPTEQLDAASMESLRGQAFRILSVHGNSQMGGYTAKFFFNTEKVLQRTTVEFGTGPKAAVFEAELSNIRTDAPYRSQSFHFIPAAGQKPTSISGAMLAIGDQAPDFMLPSTDGAKLALSSQRRGMRATLVNFWYFNCAPCRIEFPEFEKLYQQFHQQGFTIVAVNRGDSAKTVSAYAHRVGLTFPIVLGGEFGKQSIFEQYKVAEAFPATYLLNGEGRIVYRTAGEDIEGLRKKLAELGFK